MKMPQEQVCREALGTLEGMKVQPGLPVPQTGWPQGCPALQQGNWLRNGSRVGGQL